MKYIYDAFISYRHKTSAELVADKLQRKLETWKKRNGKTLDVFRDRTHLAATSDLPPVIKKALEQSRFLIIVWSPAYVDIEDSPWCMRELEYFQQTHGGNDNILMVLAEGEPDESFMEKISSRKKVAGAQARTEPNWVDMRGKRRLERKKKLRVEYLRIAAPLLETTFDKLYRRAQRRKNAFLAAGIAVLAAFAVYSTILITQISSKQKELYQNESIRLANEAMLLMEDDPALAGLLANAALPENLKKPEYPVTPEADHSIRSAALQHMYNEAASPFTLKATVTDTNILRFFDNGNYFSTINDSWTRLYEARSGRLVATIPSQEVFFFFDGAIRCVHYNAKTLENGEYWSGYSVFDVQTGEELWWVDGCYPSEASPQLAYEKETERLWLVDSHDAYDAYGWFDQAGVFHEENIQLEDDRDLEIVLEIFRWRIQNWWRFGFDYLASAEDLPEEYQQVMDDVMEEGNTSQICDISGISKCSDGALYVLDGENGYGEYICVVWSTEAHRVIWSDELPIYQDKDSQLFYQTTSSETRIYEANLQNIGGPQTDLAIDRFSENGAYVFLTLNMDDEHILYAYDMSMPEGQYHCISHGYRTYDVTPDGTKVAVAEGDRSVSFVDMASGEVLFRTEPADGDVLDVAVNEDGTLIAYAVKAETGAELYLYDTAARECVGRNAVERIDNWWNSIMLTLRNQLLMVVPTTPDTWIYHVEDFAQEPQHIEGHDYFEENERHYMLTSDGLLILPNHHSRSPYIGADTIIWTIIDTKTWEDIGFVKSPDSDYLDFYYDAASGSLIQRCSDDIYVQRRGKSGDFELVYTITLQYVSDHTVSCDDDYDLDFDVISCDGNWLMIQDDQYCEIYRLEDGALCYTLRKAEGADRKIAVVNGQLYDLGLGWSQFSIPLPDTAEARAHVQSVLAQDGGRTLNDQEMKKFYIPSHWREK